MKEKKYSVYATNKGGRIESPKGTPKGEPVAAKTAGKDLRVKKG